MGIRKTIRTPKYNPNSVGRVANLHLPDVDVDLKVEEHEEHEGEDAEGDEAEPVVRDRVGRVLAELGHVEAGTEKGENMNHPQ